MLCGRRVPPNYDTPPLTAAAQAVVMMNEKKRFSDFAETFFIISSEKKNRSISEKNYKSFLSEKNPTSIFKIGGILAKKNISQIS